MLRSRRGIAGLTAVAVLGGGAAAIAATTGPPSVEQVSATIVFDHVSVKHRDCVGADGLFNFEDIVTVTGTVSGDDRLSGRITAHLTNDGNDNGDGTEEGTFRIRDGVNGAWKAQGRFANADAAFISQGMIVGETRNPPTSSGDRSRLFAGLHISFNEDGSITGQIGGELPAGPLPAVVSSSHCTGPFVHVDADLPAPGGSGAPGAAAHRSHGRWAR